MGGSLDGDILILKMLASNPECLHFSVQFAGGCEKEDTVNFQGTTCISFISHISELPRLHCFFTSPVKLSDVIILFLCNALQCSLQVIEQFTKAW